MDDRFSADQELIAENAALKQSVLDLERSAAEVSAYRVGRPGSRQVGVLFNDITLPTQTGAWLRAPDRDTHAILHTVGAPIFVKDNNHRFVLANRACCELLGMAEADVIGQTLAEHIPEHEMRHFFAVDRGVLDTGIPDVSEETLTISDVTRTIVTKKTRFIDGSGNKFLVGAIYDITERTPAEAALHESGDRLAEAQAVAKMGSWETNLSTMEVHWSEELYRVFELDPSSFAATHAAFLGFVHPEDRAAVDAAFVESIDRDSINAIEHRIITPSGLVKSVEERWRIHHDEQGRPVRAAGTCQDITERKRANQALQGITELLSRTCLMAKIGWWELDLSTQTLLF